MKAEIIIDRETQKVKLVFDWQNGKTDQSLSVDEAENVVRMIEQEARHASREAFRQWLLQFECREDVIVVDGKKYRFKQVSEREFLTKFGHVSISRPVMFASACRIVLSTKECVDAAEGSRRVFAKVGGISSESDDGSKNRRRHGRTTRTT